MFKRGLQNSVAKYRKKAIIARPLCDLLTWWIYSRVRAFHVFSVSSICNLWHLGHQIVGSPSWHWPNKASPSTSWFWICLPLSKQNLVEICQPQSALLCASARAPGHQYHQYLAWQRQEGVYGRGFKKNLRSLNTLLLCSSATQLLCPERFQNNCVDCYAWGVHFGCIIMLE